MELHTDMPAGRGVEQEIHPVSGFVSATALPSDSVLQSCHSLAMQITFTKIRKWAIACVAKIDL
jgi:hypothetical protein